MVNIKSLLIAVVFTVLIGANAQLVPQPEPVGPTGGVDGPVPQGFTGEGSDRTYLPAEIVYVQELITGDLYERIWDVDWSPNGSYLAVGARKRYGTGELRIYSFNGTNLSTVISWTSGYDVMAVEWSPSGNHLAVCNFTSGDHIWIYSFNGIALTKVASIRFGYAIRFAWSPDGRYLAATGSNSNNELSVFSFNGATLTLVDSHDLGGMGEDVAWNSEGTRLAVAWNSVVSIYPYITIGEAAIISFDGSSLATEWRSDKGMEIFSLDWSPDGDHVAVGYGGIYPSYPVEVYHISEELSGGTVMDLRDSYNFQSRPESMSWSPSSGYLAVAGGNEVRISSFDGSALRTDHSYAFGSGSARGLSWSSDGRYMAIGGRDGFRDLKVYQVDYGPLSANDTEVMDEDTTKTLDVLANDRTTSGDLTITNVTQGAHGLVEITPDGKDLMYTPPANWSGNISITYRHSDMLDESPSAVVNITVNPVNDVPEITTADVVVATEDELYSVPYVVTDADPDDIATWSYDSDAEWLSFDEDTGLLSGLPTNDDVGAYWVNVSVTDTNATHDRHSYLLRVMNVNDDPVIMSEDTITIDEDELYSVYYQAEDVDPTNDKLVWSLDTNAKWLSMVGNHLFGTPWNHHVRDHPVNITVSDGNGGIAWTEFNITVVNVNDRPVIINENDHFATEDKEYNVTYKAWEVDVGDTVTWFLEGPAWLEMDENTGVLSGTPSNDDVGMHWVIIEVSDGKLENWASFPIFVENVNDAPAWVMTPGDQELMEGDLMFFEVLAEDDDGDRLTYGLASTPNSGITITPTTGVISWMEAVPGIYTVEINATDGTEMITHLFIITVDAEPEPPANKVPVIDDVGELNVTAGESFQLSLVGSDGDVWDATNLTFTLASGPAGMVVSADGLILWLPSDDQAGTHPVVVSLSDSKNWTTVDFDVEVLEADKPTVEEVGDDYMWMVIALAVVVVVLILLMVFMYVKQG